jgi:hypothetical protein
MRVNNFDIFFNKVCLLFIICLIIFSFFNSLLIGLSWDEIFHHVNGLLRFEYLKSLGEFQDYNYFNNRYYPGLYDTISYTIGHIFLLINENFYNNYIVEIKHFVNFAFSFSSLVGFYLIINLLFNKSISLLATLLTLLNPFFFGHMGINPKDTIIFFSLIYFCYFFYKYLVFEKHTYLNLCAASFFIGFGCGVRLSFVAIIFPIFVIGLIYLLKNYKNYRNLPQRIVVHSIISFLIIFCLVILCWPHVHLDFFSLILSTIKNSINWSAGPRLGLINGVFYETSKTPTTYFLDMFKFKIPIFFSILIFFSYYIFFTNKKFFSELVENFRLKFMVINILVIFPIFVSIIFSVKIYDYLRLFIFIIPFVSLISSLSLYFFLKNFNNSLNSKLSIFFILFFFLVFFFRFISLTPYQYTYVNFSNIKIKNSFNKFEHDYWGTSFKELVINIKKQHNQSELDNFKFSVCGGDKDALLFYLKKYLNISKLYNPNVATHIIMTNRASFDISNKVTCFNQYPGFDLISVSRNQLPFSIFRKLSN